MAEDQKAPVTPTTIGISKYAFYELTFDR